MRYWSYLAAKLAVAFSVLYGVRWVIVKKFPYAEPFSFPMAHRERYYIPNDPFLHDINYTFTMLVFTLFAVALLWLIVWDQRYRCRTCLRRLRMPILTGSWTHILFVRPRTEYSCPYGHGTLKVDELQITGHQ